MNVDTSRAQATRQWTVRQEQAYLGSAEACKKSPSGGAYAYASAPDALKWIYERYGRVLSSEYSFTYTSAEPLRDGVNRSLSADLTGASGAGTGQGRYNPGGLVPEVAKAGPWGLFLGLLVALLVLLAIPGLIRRGLQAIQDRRTSVPEARKKPGVRLHDQSSPRVRLC